jgi:hypothetical protein
MIRTQLYITEEQMRDIKLKAKRENKREAEVIRELLSEGMKKSARKTQESTGDSLLRLAAIGGKGPADLSSRVDDYLYGENS